MHTISSLTSYLHPAIINRCKVKKLDRVRRIVDNKKADSPLADIRRNTFEIAVLLDFYGQLLTDRQREVLDLHYNSDLSLGEIAEELNISRQAAHDSIRKGKAILTGYEERLGLINRFQAQENSIREALGHLQKAAGSVPAVEEDEDFKRAVKSLHELLDTL